MYPLVFRHKLSQAVKISDTFVLRRLQTQSSDKLRKQSPHHTTQLLSEPISGGVEMMDAPFERVQHLPGPLKPLIHENTSRETL